MKRKMRGITLSIDNLHRRLLEQIAAYRSKKEGRARRPELSETVRDLIFEESRRLTQAGEPWAEKN